MGAVGHGPCIGFASRAAVRKPFVPRASCSEGVEGFGELAMIGFSKPILEEQEPQAPW